MSILKRIRLIAVLLASTSLGAAVRSPSYPGRAAFIKEHASHCFSANTPAQAHTPEQNRLRRALATLKQSPNIGAPLVRFAEKHGLLYCTGITPYDGQTRGIYDDQTGAVRLWMDAEENIPFGQLTSALGHETFHAVQGSAMPPPNFSWPLRDALLAHISRDAAARTVETLLALDLAQNGHAGMEGNAKIVEAFNAARHRGVPHKKALLEAGRFGFYHFMRQKELVNVYTDDTLDFYLRYADNAPTRKAPFTLSYLRNVGHLTPQFNFTSHATYLPTTAAMLNSDPAFLHAIDYTEYHRWRSKEGENGTHAAALHQKMLEEKNPYINLNLLQLRTLLGLNTGIPVVEMMNMMRKKHAP